MSGSAGGNRITRESVAKTVDSYINRILKKFPAFKIANNFAYTSSRRFDKKGIWYMIKLAWKSWLNTNNDEFFKKDFNYWK